jgi:hypothetical protein
MRTPSFRRARAVSGRPLAGEYAPYAQPDIDLVVGEDAVEILASQERRTLAFLEPLKEEKVAGLTYAPGKWTFKQVVGHLLDDERIFAYRALCIARSDGRPLPGFDEKAYMDAADFEARALVSLLDEYGSVRRASLALFAGLGPEAWRRRGIVDDYEASVRGLAFHIAAHEQRHIRSLQTRYLAAPA